MKKLKRKRFVVSCLVLVAVAVLSLPVDATAQKVNDVNIVEDPNLLAELQMPGTIEGTGTYFEVNDSNYLNITFESSEPVHLSLESVPEMVVMDINAASDANWTEITLTGFEPSTTYYKYEDDYHNEVAFTTDLYGTYTFTQDLSEPHLVFIQPEAGTIFIPSDTSVGTWDPITRTYTLTTDVYETIQIDEDDLTLDGAGYTMTALATLDYGVYLYGRTGVTIKNLNIRNFRYGILLAYSTGNTLTGNTTSNNWRGIYLRYSSGNTLIDNTTSNTHQYGILLVRSSSNTLTANSAISSYAYGIHLYNSHNNEVYNNNFIANSQQAYVRASSGNVFNLDSPTGGNYWSDWTSPDNDGDGFVDSPYVFTGGQDNLPWTVQDGWLAVAPTWPDGSTLTASDVSLTSLTLTWTPAEHNVGVSEYMVFHDEGLMGTVDGTVTTCEIVDLDPNTEYIFMVEACDGEGNCSTDGPSAAVRTLTPVEATGQLAVEVLALNLQEGIENSLDVKLDTVLKSLDDLNTNNDVAAINSLQAFINAVEAQRGHKISEADADGLIVAAQETIAVLSAE
jgi:parallel beta-helix repeat protein